MLFGLHYKYDSIGEEKAIFNCLVPVLSVCYLFFGSHKKVLSQYISVEMRS